MLQIKTLRYPGFNGHNGTLAYAIDKSSCVFTGITDPSESTSTINAVEEIVRQIAQEERRPVENIAFYDLQTHLAYRHQPGQFHFDRVRFAQPSPPSEPSWHFVACPPPVITLFREYINGEKPVQTNDPTWPQAQQEQFQASLLTLPDDMV